MKLSTKNRIQKTLDQGRTWGSGPLRFFHLPSKDNTLGFIVPKKLYRRSVDRNRIKRLVRESWRQLEIPPSGDWTLMIRSGLDPKKTNFGDIQSWIKQGLRKISRPLLPA